ncbi:MAE_28990/MAE_18760 family HEPN-like nuclease [Pontibacter sp. 13R65]|uniref:MAE_28990/MAE_18760 family HEPN-like nuclease n=1 Tax=Pontibacter sp. 13R65 TaxID=3127458 RepID=UPI00301BBB2F
MIDVIYDYRERVAQIDKYLSLVWVLDNIPEIGNLSSIASKKAVLSEDDILTLDNYLEESSVFKLEGELIKILKSSTILLFYNLIEGTISSVLNEYFGIINNEGACYNNFKKEVKNIWIKYKHRAFSVKGKKEVDYIVTTVENVFNEIVEIALKTIKDSELGNKLIYNYEAYAAETQANEVSGNLDARKIREVFKLYGLPEINISCNSMLKVKNKRNSLAHGNETFAQVGSNFTVEELFRMKKDITGFLEVLLFETEGYINDKRYLESFPDACVPNVDVN